MNELSRAWKLNDDDDDDDDHFQQVTKDNNYENC